jgi:ATP-dependent protease ClpP protease subunit
MTKLTTLAVVAAVSISATVIKAHAMDYSYSLGENDTLLISAKGEIAFEEKDVFQKWMVTLPKDVLKRKNVAFVLDSPGGNPYGAYDVAELIHKNGGLTAVDENGTCASSCVLIWGAGAKKMATITSKIGVHGVRYDPTKVAASTSKAELDKAAKETPLYEATTTLSMAQQLKMYGAPDRVVVKAIMTPPSDVYWLTADDAKDWGAEVIDGAKTASN